MTQQPANLRLADANIGIITALSTELAAVRIIFGCSPYAIPSTRKGAAVSYFMATITNPTGCHVIAISSLVDMGNNMAAVFATQLLNDCPNVKHILMVGIGGAIPNPLDIEKHVRLGDIVVSDSHGVVQFDLGKQEATGTFTYRGISTKPSAVLLNTVRTLQADAAMGRYPWNVRIENAIAVHPDWKRLPDAADILKDANDVVQHPNDSERVSGWPKVFLGPIASSNTLLKDATKRDELRKQHDVRAVEMEGAGIADATWLQSSSYLIIRGTCDYCNQVKDKTWQKYAALIAAAYSATVIEYTPITTNATDEPPIAAAELRGWMKRMEESLASRTTSLLLEKPPEDLEVSTAKESLGYETKINVQQHISDEGLDASLGARQSLTDPSTNRSAVPEGIPTATRIVEKTLDDVTIIEIIESTVKRVISDLGVFEIERAIVEANKLQQLISQFEERLPTVLLVDSLLLLGRVATISAQKNVGASGIPDLTVADSFIARAQNAINK